MPHDALTPSRQSLLAERARFMRFAPTAEERLLWQALRGRRLGVAFRRQVPIGRFIVDLLAPAEHLVVEIEGATARRSLPALRQCVDHGAHCEHQHQTT